MRSPNLTVYVNDNTSSSWIKEILESVQNMQPFVNCTALDAANPLHHDDVIKGKHFPRYWPFVRGIHRSPVNSPHKGQ